MATCIVCHTRSTLLKKHGEFPVKLQVEVDHCKRVLQGPRDEKECINYRVDTIAKSRTRLEIQQCVMEC